MKLTGFAGSLSPASWALFSRDDILIVIFWSEINRHQGQVLQSYISFRSNDSFPCSPRYFLSRVTRLPLHCALRATLIHLNDPSKLARYFFG